MYSTQYIHEVTIHGAAETDEQKRKNERKAAKAADNMMDR